MWIYMVRYDVTDKILKPIVSHKDRTFVLLFKPKKPQNVALGPKMFQH